LSPLAGNAHELVDCFHHDEAEPGSVSPAEACALVNGSELLRFTPEILEGTYYDQAGLSCIILAQGPMGAYLLRDDGRFLEDAHLR
jgi:hypothetical protein